MNESFNAKPDHPAAPGRRVTMRLELSRSSKRRLLFADMAAAIPLASTGVDMLNDGIHLVSGAISLAAAILLFIFGIRELREINAGSKDRHGIQWLELTTALACGLDAWKGYNPAKGFQPAYLYVLLGVLYVARGVTTLGPKMTLRRLSMTETGFTILNGPIRWMRCSWKDVESLRLEGSVLRVKSGKRVRGISLARLENPQKVVESLEEFRNAQQNPG